MAAPLRSLGLIDRISYSLASIFRPSLYPSSTVTLRITSPILPLAAATSIPLRLPNLLGDIWESILRAVPKKKTSHRKKRQRFLAGKALKNETALNKCPACGTVKKAHFLCPWCVREIQDMWKGRESKQTEEPK